MRLPSRWAPGEIDKTELDYYLTLCQEIEDSVPDLEERLEKWNSRAYEKYQLSDFMTYYGSMDRDTFVRTMLLPHPTEIDELIFSELVAVITCIIECDVDEPTLTWLFRAFEVNLPCAPICDLIYQPAEVFEDFEESAQLSAEQVVSYALLASKQTCCGVPENVRLPFILKAEYRRGPISL